MISRETLPVVGLAAITLGSLFLSKPAEPALNSQLLGLATEMSKQRSSVVCISFNCGGVAPAPVPAPAAAPAPAPAPNNPNFVYYRVPLEPNAQPVDQNGTPLPIYQDETGQPYTLAAR